ncbi:MAG: NAD(P)-binding domain-containing protein, partial [Rhodospirillales bacterium]
MASGFKKVVVMGLGYVGLPTAAVLASRGVDVLGVDINPKTVELINQGRIHIEEPDLDIMVHGAVAAGRLRAAVKPKPADAFIVAVPTPFKDDHQPDLAAIESAARLIAPALAKGTVVVLESTVPVGTTEKLSTWLAEQRAD